MYIQKKNVCASYPSLSNEMGIGVSMLSRGVMEK